MRFDLALEVRLYVLSEWDAFIVSQRRVGFRIASLVLDNDFPFLPQNLARFDARSLNRHSGVAEKFVGVNFTVFVLLKVGVEPLQLTDMSIRDQHALVSEVPFHRVVEVRAID